MLFSELPQEIIDQILIAAVKVRSIKRATRLRYVSKSWNAAVMEAIFASRILDDQSPMNSFWPRYVAYRALGRPERLSRPLRIIRQVAERLVMHRNSANSGNAHDTLTHDAVKDCVFDICHLPSTGFQCGLGYSSDWVRDVDGLAESVDDDDHQYKQALLAAAAWKNEVTLIRTILPSFRGNEHLIYHDGTSIRDFRMIFGYPMCLAAFQGHNEVIRLFMDEIGASGYKDSLLRDQVMFHAANGNQLSTVELALETEFVPNRQLLANGLRETASVEIFQRLLPLVRNKLGDEASQDLNQGSSVLLLDQLVAASRQGNLAMIDHVFRMGPTPRAIWDESKGLHWNPMLQAIKNGRKEALRFLLHKGFSLHSKALVLVARNRDSEMIQIVFDNVDQSCDITVALLVAVEMENEVAVRMLLSVGATGPTSEAMAVASQNAKKRGLESMASMLL